MKKMRGFLSVIIAVLIMFPLAIVNAEEPAAEYTVKFDIINGMSWYVQGQFDDVIVNEANGYLVADPGEPYSEKGIFVGWYTDKTYSTKFDFTKEIKSNTTVYAKYLLRADVEKKIKDKLDAANLVATSTLTEKEALEFLKNSNDDPIENSITFDGNSVPTVVDSTITIALVDDYYTSHGNIYELKFDVSIDNVVVFSYYYEVPIKFANTENEDAALKEKADNIVSNLENEIVFEDYTEMTDQQLHSEHDCFKSVTNKIDELDTNNDFNVVKITEFYSNSLFYPNRGQSYHYSLALTNGDYVYAYDDNNILYAYKISVDPTVDDNHAAYLADIKDKLMDFLVNTKGYNKDDIEIDPDGLFDTYSASRMIVRIGGEQGEIYSFYMVKDENSILLAKNLLINKHDYANSEVYSLSYSENKEILETEFYRNSLQGIEELKSSLENDGYDFFEGYYIAYRPEEGKSINLTFTVGKDNNNRRIKVLHRLDDGTVEKFEGIVKDGAFTIEITQGSPFAVGLGEVVKALKNNPQTFDPIILSVLMLALSAIGLIGGSIYLTKSRLN